MKYLFCNIGWMEFYQGNLGKDKILGGGSHIKETGEGFEVCNFAEHQNKVFGYVQTRSSSIKLEKIVGANADTNSESETEVLVIWTAPRPEGGTVVIGSYKNATVYREHKKFKTVPTLYKKNKLYTYRIQAQAKDATLLPIDKRVISIPRKVKGDCMGQSNIWYGNSTSGIRISAEVYQRDYGKKSGRATHKFTKTTDHNHNAKVELAAINCVREYYEKWGYEITSVETENRGWDLEATQENIKLHIEVKGLSGEAKLVQLTPNEYKAFKKKNLNYRLAVVTQALEKPTLHICHYSSNQKQWKIIDNNNSTIDIKERIAAQIKIKT